MTLTSPRPSAGRQALAVINRARPGVFVCGDDRAARKVVAGLIADIGAEPICQNRRFLVIDVTVIVKGKETEYVISAARIG